MTMVPAPKLSKPLQFFNRGCGAGGGGGAGGGVGSGGGGGGGGGGAPDVTTRFSDGYSGVKGYDGGYNNITPNKVNYNCVVASESVSNNNNFSYHNTSHNLIMAEEEQSRTSNTSVNDDDGDHQQPAASASMRGRDDTPTPTPPSDHHHHQDSSSSWLQLGVGGSGTQSSSYEQQHSAQMMHITGGSGDGLMLELNLGGISHQTTTLGPSRVPQQGALDFGIGSTSFYGGGGSSATVYISPPPQQHHHLHHPIFPLIPSNPQPLLSLSEDHQQHHQIGGQGSYLTRPFIPSGSSVDSEFRLIYPPPRRPHSGIWFTLQASLHQSREPILPQVSKSFLRIKDGRMTIRLLMKYMANKLGLDSESEVEIQCRGQQLVPFLTLQHVRDNIWSPREADVTLLPDSSTSQHLMVLNYGRSSVSSSTQLAATST